MARFGIFSLALAFSLSLPHAALGAEGQTLEAVKVGVGNVTLGALLQAWAINETNSPHENFRLRRAELSLTGSVVESTRWFLKIDAAKSLRTGPVTATNDNKILQDFGVAFTVIPGLEFVLGQFKSPTTYEGTSSTADLPLPERSLSGRTFGDRREIGLLVNYTTGIIKAQAMLSDGGTTNVEDTNDNKDLHLRVEVAPTKELLAGVFTTFGDFSFNTKGRIGGNVKYLPITGVTVRGELVAAKDAGINSTGYMADVSYLATEQIQPVVRVDGIAGATFTGTAFSVGANYLVKGNNARATLAYAHLNNMTDGGGTYTLLNNTHGHIVWLAFQAAL